MNYVINEEYIVSKGHSVHEILFLMLCKTASIEEVKQNLLEKKLIYQDDAGECIPTLAGNDIMEKMLLSGDKTVPEDERCRNLARKLMDIFPKGGKQYSMGGKIQKIPWRGNIADITKKLKKLFKLYDKYTDEQIINATQSYVNLHNGGDDSMRVLSYFILKDERKVDENGKGYIEQKSDLAAFIESEMENNNVNTDFGEII